MTKLAVYLYNSNKMVVIVILSSECEYGLQLY